MLDFKPSKHSSPGPLRIYISSGFLVLHKKYREGFRPHMKHVEKWVIDDDRYRPIVARSRRHTTGWTWLRLRGFRLHKHIWGVYCITVVGVNALTFFRTKRNSISIHKKRLINGKDLETGVTPDVQKNGWNAGFEAFDSGDSERASERANEREREREAHTHTHTYTNTGTRTHAHTHTLTQTHTQTHTHTRTHTHHPRTTRDRNNCEKDWQV